MKKKKFLTVSEKSQLKREARAVEAKDLPKLAKKWDVSMSTVRKQLRSRTGIRRAPAVLTAAKEERLLQAGALVQQATDLVRDLGYTVQINRKPS